MTIVRSKRIQDFLYENGVEPVRLYYDGARYITTSYLLSLLDYYTIKTICIPNKW